MASLKFYTQSRAKRKKAVPLYLRLYEGKILDEWIKLPILVNPSLWSNKMGKFKQGVKNNLDEKLLKEIEDTETKLRTFEKHVLREMRATTDRNKDWIQNVVNDFFNPSNEAKNLKTYIQKYIDDAMSGRKLTFRGGTKFSPATIKSIKSMQTELDKYQDELKSKIEAQKQVAYKPKSFPIDFADINIDLYNDWISFFNKKKYSPNTIGKHVKWLKTIMRDAKENNLHDNDEFERKAFKTTSSEAETIFLNEAELKKIYELDLTDNPELVIPRDIFLIGCYTAQRFSDYSRINRITELEDGTKVIKLTQIKTGTKVTIPIRTELMAILQKYEISKNEIKLPHISEQYFNKQIKKVGAEAEINDKVEIKKVRGGMTSVTTYPKYSLITSHTARRSGCSNLFNAEVPSQYIMKLSGHKTEREFLKYLKLTPDDIAKKLSKHNYFLGNVLKIAK